MKTRLLLTSLFLFSRFAFGSGALPATLDNLAKSNLKFIAAEQVPAHSGLYFPGEWPTRVYTSALPLIAGVGRIGHDEEPTAFTTASVVNQLAVIYKMHPEFKTIPRMILSAVPSFDRYKEGDLYNFYPARISNGVRVHQTVAMTLLPIWEGLTNIPEDADTSSVTYAARFYSDKIWDPQAAGVPAAVLQSFSTYRDENRESHYYNSKEGLHNTGAFLTWQFDENSPTMPRFYFADPSAGTRIPFNVNDIDCIVNLNVLRLLALTGNSHLPGRDQSCQMLNLVIQKSEYSSCGIYYPNTFNFAYSASLATEAGETCFESSKNQIVDFVESKQSPDGGWYNVDNMWTSDRVLATAFAIYSLAEFGNQNDPQVRAAIARGADYLLTRTKVSPEGHTYWPGEIFFTATAVARSLVIWRSDSFTTAVALSAILKAHDQAGWQPAR